jgi:hypothetical protein
MSLAQVSDHCHTPLGGQVAIIERQLIANNCDIFA